MVVDEGRHDCDGDGAGALGKHLPNVLVLQANHVLSIDLCQVVLDQDAVAEWGGGGGGVILYLEHTHTNHMYMYSCTCTLYLSHTRVYLKSRLSTLTLCIYVCTSPTIKTYTETQCGIVSSI